MRVTADTVTHCHAKMQRCPQTGRDRAGWGRRGPPLGDQHHRRDFTGTAAGLSALRDDQVDAGGGVPQRVLSGPGQGGHHDVVGEGHVEQRLHRDTAWFTRPYLIAPSSSVAGRSWTADISATLGDSGLRYLP